MKSTNRQGVMAENGNEINNGHGPDIRTRYEILIAGIAVAIICIIAFATFRIMSYMNSANASEDTITTLDVTDGTVVIEVEINDTSSDNSGDDANSSTAEGEDPVATVGEHDDITVFTLTTQGNDFYKSKEGRLKLYAEPKETDADRPALIETAAFRVLGFSRDGWAAIEFGGARYYVKSAEIVSTSAPDDAPEYVAPSDTKKIKFFKPVGDKNEYKATMNTVAFSLPDVQSSGNRVNLKAGETVKVTAIGGAWYKIDYMNAEYYVISYLEPTNGHVEEP
ncbi:MAG: hypothetical protein MJ098_05480 [Saccharofermentans sp.]|nr:hypothetical protein [Saccharofermentans sp.]